MGVAVRVFSHAIRWQVCSMFHRLFTNGDDELSGRYDVDFGSG